MRKEIYGTIGALLLFTSCTMMENRPLVIGHRGAMGHVMENTLASVQKAMDMGVDMIEIDVFKIKSGEIVVFHDEDLDRLTDGQGKIEDRTLSELKALTLEGGHKIPELREVLDLLDNRVALNIELKGSGTAIPVNDLIERYIREKGWYPRNFVISSFRWDELRTMRAENELVQIAVLTDKAPEDALAVARELKAMAINPHFSTLNQDNVAHIHGEGLRIFPWTVNEPSDIQKMKELGVDGIITNFPERIH